MRACQRWHSAIRLQASKSAPSACPLSSATRGNAVHPLPVPEGYMTTLAASARLRFADKATSISALATSASMLTGPPPAASDTPARQRKSPALAAHATRQNHAKTRRCPPCRRQYMLIRHRQLFAMLQKAASSSKRCYICCWDKHPCPAV